MAGIFKADGTLTAEPQTVDLRSAEKTAKEAASDLVSAGKAPTPDDVKPIGQPMRGFVIIAKAAIDPFLSEADAHLPTEQRLMKSPRQLENAKWEADNIGLVLAKGRAREDLGHSDDDFEVGQRVIIEGSMFYPLELTPDLTVWIGPWSAIKFKFNREN